MSKIAKVALAVVKRTTLSPEKTTKLPILSFLSFLLFAVVLYKFLILNSIGFRK